MASGVTHHRSTAWRTCDDLPNHRRLAKDAEHDADHSADKYDDCSCSGVRDQLSEASHAAPAVVCGALWRTEEVEKHARRHILDIKQRLHGACLGQLRR